MRIEEYKNICDNVQVPDIVLAGYQSAIHQIKNENIKQNLKEEETQKWRGLHTITKAAILFGAVLVLAGTTFLSVRAYISHMQKLRNMQNEEIIDLYENIFQYDSKYRSRPMTETEEERYTELYDLYCRDMADPEGEVGVISSKASYTGKGLAFSTGDGILYLPEKEMTDEEILQMIEFDLLGRYVDYEAYVKAGNPLYYKNYLEQMTTQQVDEIYTAYHRANTETCFVNRELTLEELAGRKALKKLYRNGEKRPAHTMTMIQKASDYKEGEIAFCTENCTYYFPEGALSEEQLLEYIDFQAKVEYCGQRIAEEIEGGIRNALPEVEYVVRDRIITLDPEMEVEQSVLAQPWVSVYAEVLKTYFEKNKELYVDPERYYANVRLIYLNDDEIPEMVFSHGYTDMDYDDRCNVRTYLYTYKDGKAVLLAPGDNTLDDFYGYTKPFTYAERKSAVYCDYYYSYGFTVFDSESNMMDSVTDTMSQVDVWDFDTMTCTSSNANIEMLHAVYNYLDEEYADADFWYEYYVNVSDIIRDETTGEVKEIVGDRVDREAYERAEEALWNGAQVTTLTVEDFDKIYSDDDLEASLARCYEKIRQE